MKQFNNCYGEGAVPSSRNIRRKKMKPETRSSTCYYCKGKGYRNNVYCQDT